MTEKRAGVFAAIFFMAAILATAGIAAQAPQPDALEKGVEIIDLPGGPLGDVRFPHRLHQESQKDCNICHDLFARQPGAIQKQQQAGALRKQQVMDELCIGCHHRLESAGKPSGPTRCDLCHQR